MSNNVTVKTASISDERSTSWQSTRESTNLIYGRFLLQSFRSRGRSEHVSSFATGVFCLLLCARTRFEVELHLTFSLARAKRLQWKAARYAHEILSRLIKHFSCDNGTVFQLYFRAIIKVPLIMRKN